MAEKSFGIKELNLIGASGTPSIDSPNNLNLNAVNVAISTNVSIGGTLSVTGNVSIGGTLTYEDVTNIDSVGIITAREGIKIPDSKKIIFGAGEDGFIESDGANFLIQGGGGGTGSTYVRGRTLILSANGGSGGYNGAVTIDKSGDERVQLKYGNDTKLVTTSSGVTVTGTLTATTFSGSGASLTSLPAANLTGTLPAISGANLTNLPADTPTNSDIQVVYTVTANGSSAYRFAGNGVVSTADDPDLYLIRGQKYRFINNSGGSHPFQIREASGGTAYSTGVTNNGAASGNIDFAPTYNSPAQLVYQCTSHSGMVGNIYLRDAAGGNINVGVTTFSGGNVSIPSGSFSLNAAGTSRFEIASIENAEIDGEIAHSGDADTKIRFPSADNISFETGGSERFRVSNSLVTVQNSTLLASKITNSSSYTSHNANFYGGDVNTGGVRIELAHTTTAVSGNTASGAFPHNLLLSNYSGSGSADNRMVSIGFDIPTTSSHANATIAYQATASNGTGDLQFWLENGNTSYERLRIKADGQIQLPANGQQLTWGASQQMKFYYESSEDRMYLQGDGAYGFAFRVNSGNRIEISKTTGDVVMQGASGRNFQWDNSEASLYLTDSGSSSARLKVGTGGDLQLYHDASGNVNHITAATNGELKSSANKHTFYDYTGVTKRMEIDSAGIVTKPYHPSFIAGRTGGNQTFTVGTFPLNVARLNVGNHYNTSTYKFVVPVAGVYYFYGQVYYNNGSGAYRFGIRKTPNGGSAFMLNTCGHKMVDNDNSISTAIIESMAVGDTVEMYSDSNASIQAYYNINDATYGAHTYFMGYLIG